MKQSIISFKTWVHNVQSEKTTNNRVCYMFTNKKDQTVWEIFSQATQYPIQNTNNLVNRADGKHCGHIHIGQWCRGKVQLTHFIIWSLFTSFICTLTNIFIWSFLVHFFCISVKQTYPSKACVDPSMKWAYENNNLNLIFFYIQCIGKICGSREPWEFLRLSTVLLCRAVRGVWGKRQSARKIEQVWDWSNSNSLFTQYSLLTGSPP